MKGELELKSEEIPALVAQMLGMERGDSLQRVGDVVLSLAHALEEARDTIARLRGRLIDMSTPRTLDWHPRFDPRSRNFPVRAVLPPEPELVAIRRQRVFWHPGPILDQGSEGACVGFGWTGEALSTPVAVDLSHLRSSAAPLPAEPNAFALALYHAAQRVDEWAGENYEGSSVLGGAKAMTSIGLLKEYRWAFSVQDVIDSVLTHGPVVIGINWYDSMYNPDHGILRVSGQIVGGHCLTVAGYTADSALMHGPSFTLRNSWGKDWGNGGLAEIAVSDLSALLQDQGEACVPVHRSYGR